MVSPKFFLPISKVFSKLFFLQPFVKEPFLFSDGKSTGATDIIQINMDFIYEISQLFSGKTFLRTTAFLKADGEDRGVILPHKIYWLFLVKTLEKICTFEVGDLKGWQPELNILSLSLIVLLSNSCPTLVHERLYGSWSRDREEMDKS